MSGNHVYYDDDPGIFTVPMTVTEDKILRLLAANGGKMSSDDIRERLKVTESVHNIYGALLCLREEGYVDSWLIDPRDWKYNYRPLMVQLQTRGALHVRNHPPILTSWPVTITSLVLVALLILVLQHFFTEPQFLAVGAALVAAILIMFLARRAGKVLTKGNNKP